MRFLLLVIHFFTIILFAGEEDTLKYEDDKDKL